MCAECGLKLVNCRKFGFVLSSKTKQRKIAPVKVFSELEKKENKNRNTIMFAAMSLAFVLSLFMFIWVYANCFCRFSLFG